MAITQAFSGTAAIGATEFSAPNNATYSAINAEVDDGVYQVFLDTSDMVAGDELRIRVYEKCTGAGDAQRIIYESFITGTMTDTWVSPSLILLHGWDVTLTTIAGGTITVLWSIRRVA
jgi:hypothetical protein